MENTDTRYVILINRLRDYNPAIIKEHVGHLKELEKSGILVLAGPFTNYNGGIIIIKANSFDEAQQIAESDPFISKGYSSYELRTLELSNKENNHLGMG